VDSAAVTIASIEIADPAQAWRDAGFTVDADGDCRVGGVRLRLTGPASGDGIVGWSLRGVPASLGEVDGIATSPSDDPPPTPAEHPNGVTSIDHVVVLSPDLDRTVTALRALGVEPRREREGRLAGHPIRQVFFRFGEVIIEAVGAPDTRAEGPASLWGITYVVADIDATAERFGDRTSPVKDAVQPGRRITTLRHRDFGMSVCTAMISAPIL